MDIDIFHENQPQVLLHVEHVYINFVMSRLYKRQSILLQGKLTASTVGSIVGMQSEEIQQIALEYAEKVST